MFKALRIHETKEGFTRSIEKMSTNELPPGDLLVQVHYSSLNYKDALSSIGNRGVTKSYPHTPGIDASGIVIESKSPLFKEGDFVVITGYDFGMNTHGGFSQIISVPASWVQKLPPGLSLKESMMLGTAGFTAAMSVAEILPYLKGGKVFVSGASGGVGSLSVKILTHLGYEVSVPLRRESSRPFLESIGVKEFIPWEEIESSKKRALLSTKFDAAIDTTGGDNLSYALKTTSYGGAVTVCGNAASADLNATVYPFILRGIRLIGIDSVLAESDFRKTIWKKLGTDWKIPLLEEGIEELPLEELPQAMDKMLRGEHLGKVLVKVKE
ncbi:MAG TPA: YhdH/YhfP family quinone oxidoreductase [Clostridia bacterium]|nr:YhdH/YhfP family quinone oxidoreductase [Clostridia bacterium]